MAGSKPTALPLGDAPLPGTGFEPVTRGFSILCSTPELSRRIRLGQVGVEPTTSRLKAECSTTELLTRPFLF